MTLRTRAVLFGVMAAGIAVISSAYDPAITDPLYNRTNDPPSLFTVARVNNVKVLFKVVFYPYSKQFKVIQFGLPQVPVRSAGTDPRGGGVLSGDFDDNDFPPDPAPFDPTDDLPLPETPDVPLPNLNEDPFDGAAPDPPPLPDEPFPFSDLSDNTLSIMDSGGEQLGYSVPPETSVKAGSRSAVAITKIRLGVQPAGMVYSPDRTTLYVANGGSGTVSVVNLKARTVKSTISIPETQLYSIAITPDGKRLFLAEANTTGVLMTVDLPAGTVTRLPISGTYVTKLAISPDGTRLWICHNLGRVTVLDLLTHALLAQPPVVAPWSIAFNRTGTRAYVTSAPKTGNGTVEVYDANTYARIASIPVGVSPRAVGVTPSGRHVFVVNNSTPGSIMQISTATNTVVRTIPAGELPSGLGMVR